MCEIFPEVETCCLVCSVRVGMLLIAVFSITSGGLTLSVVEKKTNFGYHSVMNLYINASQITEPGHAVSMVSEFIAATLTAISVLYMLAGLLLIFADFSDQEGIAQMFVWLVLLCIIIGGILVFAIAFECIMQPVCLLGDMDWLTAAASLILMVFYLIMWFYFLCVVNSYVLNGYS